eukprot:2106727-Rhodomonas_salina.1
MTLQVRVAGFRRFPKCSAVFRNMPKLFREIREIRAEAMHSEALFRNVGLIFGALGRGLRKKA